MKNYITGWLIVLCLCMPAVAQVNTNGSPADQVAGEAKARQMVANSCAKMKPRYEAVKNWVQTHKGTQPDIPTPPVIDPNCHDCTVSNYEDKNQAILDSFNKKATEPEADMIRTLLGILRAKAILSGATTTNDMYIDSKTYPCLNQFGFAEINSMLKFLEGREYDKAEGMLDKYKNDGKYYLGGIGYYLGIMRSLALIDYSDNTAGGIDPGVNTWVMAYYERYKTRLFEQYQYQLYPGIFYLPRQMALIAGNNDTSKYGQYAAEQLQEATDTWNKAISMMHFRLKITYYGLGQDVKNGDYVKASFSGETEIRCRLNNSHDNPCYEWVPESGGTMTFKIKDVETSEQHGKEVFKLAGPTEFTVPVHFNVSLCDKQPLFRMYFDKLWPDQEYYTHNQVGAVEDPILQQLVLATLGKANVGSMEKNVDKMKEAAKHYSQAEMEALSKRLQAHANDMQDYIKTPQGQKDYAVMQQLKRNFGSVSPEEQQNMNQLNELRKKIDQKEASDPHYNGSAEYFKDSQKLQDLSDEANQGMQTMTGGAMTMNKLELPFRLGTNEPVNGTVGDQAGEALKSIGIDHGSGDTKYISYFKVTVVNTPDNRNNIK